jgi:hypothetical protein
VKWLPDGPCAIKREDGAYRIFRGPQEGFVAPGGMVTLALVDSIKHEHVAVRRVPDDRRRIERMIEKLKGMADVQQAEN